MDLSIERIQPIWFDYAILYVTFNLGHLGHGLWRGNPNYALHPKFQQILTKRINELMESQSTDMDLQELWEIVKKKHKAGYQIVWCQACLLAKIDS